MKDNLSRLRHLPNIITLLRIAVVPGVALTLVQDRYATALLLFLAAGASDMLDGYIARRFGFSSRLGSILDPVADKLLIITVAVTLAWQGIIPWWLAAGVVARDLVIFGGASTYFVKSGGCDMEPSLLGKANTCIQIGYVLLLLGHHSLFFDASTVLPVALGVTALSTLASGVHYVIVWSRKGRDLARRKP